MQISRTVWSGQAPVQWLLAAFTIVSLIAPTVVFWGVHFFLSAIDKTALPWFGIFITAAIILVVLVPMAILLVVGSYRASNQVGSLGIVIKCLMVSSVLWVPPTAFRSFMLISAIFSSLSG